MRRSYDVIVIGAGIIGLSIAYQLKKAGCSRVLVLEKEEGWIGGSSARANGGFRQQFSTAINMRLSQLSLAVFERFADEFETDISFRQAGYLFVTATRSGDASLARTCVYQQEAGVPVQRVNPEEIRRLVPLIRCEDLISGNYCALDGYADSYSIAAGFGKKALELGVEIQLGSAAQAIHTVKGRIEGVSTLTQRYDAPVAVNAAGPYAREIGKLAGVEVPVDPVRRMILLSEPVPGLERTIPMTIDVESGLFLRTESGRILMGWSDPSEPIGFNLSFDPGHIDAVAERAVIRFPELDRLEINPQKCWAGLYEVSPDHHCILGESPDLAGFFLANGFSGHGMMHSPAVGMVLSDLILGGKTELLDISPLRPSRFAEGDLIHESIVI